MLWQGVAAAATDGGDATEDIPYGKRISDAITGFIIGWILLIFSMLLIFVVEKEAMGFDLILSKCRKATRVLTGAIVRDDNEGRVGESQSHP